MLKDSMAYAKEDMLARALAEQRVEADRVIEGLVSALQADGDELLNEQERQTLLQAIERLIELRNGDNADAIEKGIKTQTKRVRILRQDEWINRFVAHWLATR